MHLVRGRRLSRELKVALLAFTVSPTLLIMLGLVITFGLAHFMWNWDKRGFAAAGVLPCVLAIVFATADAMVSKSLVLGVIMGSLLDIVIWGYLALLR